MNYRVMPVVDGQTLTILNILSVGVSMFFGTFLKTLLFFRRLLLCSERQKASHNNIIDVGGSELAFSPFSLVFTSVT